MSEGYHRGTSKVWVLPKKPAGWKITQELNYPLTILLADKTEITFLTYQEHHLYIKQLFNKKNNGNSSNKNNY